MHTRSLAAILLVGVLASACAAGSDLVTLEEAPARPSQTAMPRSLAAEPSVAPDLRAPRSAATSSEPVDAPDVHVDEPGAPERARWIAIGSGLDHEGGLYLAGSDGSGPREISHELEQAHGPTWSPDGRWIACNGFASVGDGWQRSDGGIYVVASDGSGQRRLTSDGWDPDWSPLGDRILFTRSGGAMGTSIVAMDPDSGDEDVILTSLGTLAAARWSPDASYIAYLGDGGFLHVMRSDGTGSRRVSPPGYLIRGPAAWSPHGRHLAFLASSPSELVDHLWVVSADGRDQRKLDPALASGGSSDASWSPDGEWIAFVSRDQLLVSVIRPDGSDRRSVTERRDGDGFQTSPAWSPDGQAIAFIRWENERTSEDEVTTHHNVWVVDLASGEEHRVAALPQPASSLAWEP